MEEIISRGLAAMGLEAEPETAALLRAYGERLLEVNAVTNLTAIREPAAVARLHMLDSAALLNAADFAGKRVLDVGTGAGFPGVVLRVLRPDVRLTVIDSVKKKIDFVADTCARLGLDDVECLWGRVEELPALRGGFDVCVSRAVAELDVLAELCLPQVAVGGLFIAMKGPDCEAEAQAADFAVRALGGRTREIVRYEIPGTDVTHAAVLVEKVAPTPPQYPRRYAQIRKKPLRG